MGSDDSETVGKTTNGSSPSQGGESAPPEQQNADHEATHGPLPKRILAELRAGAQQAGAVGTKTGGQLVGAAEELRLEVVETHLEGKRALVGHALGMRLIIPAEGIHGPRETAALLCHRRE